MEVSKPLDLALAPRAGRDMPFDERQLVAFERSVDEPGQQDVGNFVRRRIDLHYAPTRARACLVVAIVHLVR
jgi:hypothetical protein